MFEELIKAIKMRNFKLVIELLEQIDAKELYRLTDQGYSALKLLCIINKVPDYAKDDYIKVIESTLARAPNLFCIDNSKDFNIHIQDLKTKSGITIEVRKIFANISIDLMNENIAKLALGAALAEENINEMRIKTIIDKYPELSGLLTYKIGQDNSIVIKYGFKIYSSIKLRNSIKSYLEANQDKNIQSIKDEFKILKIHSNIDRISYKDPDTKALTAIADKVNSVSISTKQKNLVQSNLYHGFKRSIVGWGKSAFEIIDNITKNTNEVRKILKLEPANRVMSLKFLCAKEIAFSDDYNLINKTEKSLPEELLPYFGAIKSIADGQPTYLNALDDEINMVLSGLTDLFMIKDAD